MQIIDLNLFLQDLRSQHAAYGSVGISIILAQLLQVGLGYCEILLCMAIVIVGTACLLVLEVIGRLIDDVIPDWDK